MSSESRIGFMQGRLVKSFKNTIQAFPETCWEEEFPKAEKIGFQKMEWVFDSLTNPILDTNKHEKIISLSQKHNICINSICADFFMTHKLFSESEEQVSKNISILERLIKTSSSLGINFLEIPFVDSSSLQSESDINDLIKNISNIVTLSEENNVIINLETDLPPKIFKELICDFNSEYLKINYDIGNSTSLGYDIQEELKYIGSDITNVHVKDRIYGGNTVPLGTGDANLELFFKILSQINYKGDFIIQGAREDEESILPEETCSKYFNLVKNYLDKYFKK